MYKYIVRNNTIDKKNNGAVACNEVAIVCVSEESKVRFYKNLSCKNPNKSKITTI